MEFEPSLATIAVEGLEEKPRIRFYDEEPLPLPRREGDEIRSVWFEITSRLQEPTSAAEAALFPDQYGTTESRALPEHFIAGGMLLWEIDSRQAERKESNTKQVPPFFHNSACPSSDSRP